LIHSSLFTRNSFVVLLPRPRRLGLFPYTTLFRSNGGVAADGRSVTWKPKRGVQWHDGTPFTADDVVFNWQYAADPATASVTISRSEEHTSELQSLRHLVCRLLLEKNKNNLTISYV